ncbi:MAG: substrate-binding domain-containing protein [Vallitaleaceae bacterium]|nr:substrate-binding domain-containing protein [Vallitaleaceae bacterium]
MKKVIAILLTAVLMLSIAGCGKTEEKNTGTSSGSSSESTTDSKEAKKHVFMFKSTGNLFGDLMYKGFEEAVTAMGGVAEYVSPAETTAAAQVALVEELIAKGVSSITISANDANAFNAIAKLAESNGVKLLSADSAISPDIRTSHTIPTTIDGVGRHLVYAAIMILAQEPYSEGMDMKAKTEEILKANKFTSDPVRIGVLSATTTSPVQNQWIASMELELARLNAEYPGNIADMNDGSAESMLDIKYGNDDPQDSVTQANAFISEDKVNVIVSPTTVGMFAAGQQLQGNPSSKIKLTGLGLPSEMVNFMPTTAANEFEAVCPYMMLWNVIDLGAVAGAAAVSAVEGKFDGSFDSSFDYNGKTYHAIMDPDSTGTIIVVGDPYVFFQGNMATWKDLL